MKSSFAFLLLFYLTSFNVGCGSSNGQETTSKVGSGKPAQPTADGIDWPHFLGADQDGICKEKGIRTDWTAGKLPVIWKRDLGEGYAPGVVVDGRYFHFDRIDDSSRLVCLNSETGELIWEFQYDCPYRDMYGYDGGPRSSPTVDENVVYIYGVEGMLHALDVQSGDVLWKADVNKRFGVHQNFFGVGSPPVVFNDKLLVMVGGSPEDNQVPQGQLDLAKPNGTAIVAFDKKSGDVLYETGDDLASYSSMRVVKQDGKDWAFAWARDGLLAFDPNDGQINFEFPWRDRKLESVNASTPVIFDNYVLLSECYGVGTALLQFGDDQENSYTVVRKDEGRDKSLMTHWNTPIYSKGFLYASSGRHTNGATLRCVDALSGEVQWSQAGLTRCNMTWVDDHLVVLAERGALFLIEANENEFKPVTAYEPANDDQVRLQYPCWAAPVISHGKMYVRGKDQVICFELIPAKE